MFLLLITLLPIARGATLADAREARDYVQGARQCAHPTRDAKQSALVVNAEGARHFVIVMGGGANRDGTLYTWSPDRSLSTITDEHADGTVDRSPLAGEDPGAQHRYDAIIAAVLTTCRAR